MLVKDLMTTSVITIRPDTTLEKVSEVLHEYHFTGIPVVDNHNVLMGTIMERDFITESSKLYLPTYIKLLKDVNFYSGDRHNIPKEVEQIMHATAKDVMSSAIVYAYPETTLEELAELFASKRVNPIPVVDSHFKIVGIISRSDLIKLFSKKSLAPALAHEPRIIDATADNSFKALDKKFVLVDKTRTSVWTLISITLFIFGFFLGIVWMLKR